jgi:hypothetical protein
VNVTTIDSQLQQAPLEVRSDDAVIRDYNNLFGYFWSFSPELTGMHYMNTDKEEEAIMTKWISDALWARGYPSKVDLSGTTVYGGIVLDNVTLDNLFEPPTLPGGSSKKKRPQKSREVRLAKKRKVVVEERSQEEAVDGFEANEPDQEEAVDGFEANALEGFDGEVGDARSSSTLTSLPDEPEKDWQAAPHRQRPRSLVMATPAWTTRMQRVIQDSAIPAEAQEQLLEGMISAWVDFIRDP